MGGNTASHRAAFNGHRATGRHCNSVTPRSSRQRFHRLRKLCIVGLQHGLACSALGQARERLPRDARPAAGKLQRIEGRVKHIGAGADDHINHRIARQPAATRRAAAQAYMERLACQVREREGLTRRRKGLPRADDRVLPKEIQPQRGAGGAAGGVTGVEETWPSTASRRRDVMGHCLP